MSAPIKSTVELVLEHAIALRAEIWRDAEKRSINSQWGLANDLQQRACGVGEAIALMEAAIKAEREARAEAARK